MTDDPKEAWYVNGVKLDKETALKLMADGNRHSVILTVDNKPTDLNDDEKLLNELDDITSRMSDRLKELSVEVGSLRAVQKPLFSYRHFKEKSEQQAEEIEGLKRNLLSAQNQIRSFAEANKDLLSELKSLRDFQDKL